MRVFLVAVATTFILGAFAMPVDVKPDVFVAKSSMFTESEGATFDRQLSQNSFFEVEVISDIHDIFPHVIGGVEVSPRFKFTSLVGLIQKGRAPSSGQFCGGTLISSTHVRLVEYFSKHSAEFEQLAHPRSLRLLIAARPFPRPRPRSFSSGKSACSPLRHWRLPP